MQKKSIETILYSAAGIGVMLVLLVVFNFIVGFIPLRKDLTADKAYTLSPGTRAILKKLDSTVTIRFYCTQGETASPQTVYLKTYGRRVEDLLEEFRQAANGKIVIQKFNPEPDSDAEDSAHLDGVEGAPMPDGEKFYMGLAVILVEEKQAIPFLDPSRERLLEYRFSPGHHRRGEHRETGGGDHEPAARLRDALQSDDGAHGPAGTTAVGHHRRTQEPVCRQERVHGRGQDR